MDEIKQDLKDIKTKLEEMSETLLRNTLSLEVHERRTDLAEQRVTQIEEKFKWLLGLLVSTAVGIALKLFKN